MPNLTASPFIIAVVILIGPNGAPVPDPMALSCVNGRTENRSCGTIIRPSALSLRCPTRSVYQALARRLSSIISRYPYGIQQSTASCQRRYCIE